MIVDFWLIFNRKYSLYFIKFKMILNVTKYRPIDFKPKFQIFQLVCDWAGIPLLFLCCVHWCTVDVIHRGFRRFCSASGSLWSHLLCSWILPRGIQKHILLSLHHGVQKEKTSHWRCRATVRDLHAILNLYVTPPCPHITPSGSRTRDAGARGGRSTKEAKGYSL